MTRFVVRESADGKTWRIIDERTKYPFDNYDYPLLALAVYYCGLANIQRKRANQTKEQVK